jgi:hypothetical protein
MADRKGRKPICERKDGAEVLAWRAATEITYLSLSLSLSFSLSQKAGVCEKPHNDSLLTIIGIEKAQLVGVPSSVLLNVHHGGRSGHPYSDLTGTGDGHGRADSE